MMGVLLRRVVLSRPITSPNRGPPRSQTWPLTLFAGSPPDISISCKVAIEEYCIEVAEHLDDDIRLPFDRGPRNSSQESICGCPVCRRRLLFTINSYSFCDCGTETDRLEFIKGGLGTRIWRALTSVHRS